MLLFRTSPEKLREKEINLMAKKIAKRTDSSVDTVKRSMHEVAESVQKETGLSIDDAEIAVYRNLLKKFQLN